MSEEYLEKVERDSEAMREEQVHSHAEMIKRHSQDKSQIGTMKWTWMILFLFLASHYAYSALSARQARLE